MTEEAFLVEDVTDAAVGGPPAPPAGPWRADWARRGLAVAAVAYLAAAGAALVATDRDAWVLGISAEPEVISRSSGSLDSTLTISTDQSAYTVRRTAWGTSRVSLTADPGQASPPSTPVADTDSGLAAGHLALLYLVGAAGLVSAAVMCLRVRWRPDGRSAAILTGWAGAALFIAVFLGELLRVLSTRALYLDAGGADLTSPVYRFAVGSAVWWGALAAALSVAATAAGATAAGATAAGATAVNPTNPLCR